jgi:hypothetical protein
LLVAARYGANAAACSWVVGFPVVFLLSMHRIARAFAVELRLLLKPMAIPILCAAIACALAELTGLAVASIPALVRLVLEAAIAAAAYWALARQLAPVQYRQVTQMLMRLIGR